MNMLGPQSDEDWDEADAIRDFTAQLAAGTSVNAKDDELGFTMLTVAVVEHFYNAAIKLLEQGADPRIGDDEGWRPLHFAGDARMVQLLLDHGAEIDARNERDETALMLAARTKDTEQSRVLLRNGASLSLRDWRGKNALDYAEAGWGRHFRATRDLLTVVTNAGSWERYVREPVVQLLCLRHLCLAGRATAPPNLVRCFGAAPIPNAGKARTRHRRAASASPLPDEVFAHILGFWHWRT